PPGRIRSNGGYWVDHLPPISQLTVNAPQAVYSIVSPGVFDTLGIPLKTGRDFSDADIYSAPFVAVVNEALAKKAVPGQDPIGRLIFCGFDSLNGMKIIGVAGDVRQWGPATPPWPEIYMPYPQHPGAASALDVLLRTPSDPLALSETVRRK